VSSPCYAPLFLTTPPPLQRENLEKQANLRQAKWSQDVAEKEPEIDEEDMGRAKAQAAEEPKGAAQPPQDDDLRSAHGARGEPDSASLESEIGSREAGVEQDAMLDPNDQRETEDLAPGASTVQEDADAREQFASHASADAGESGFEAIVGGQAFVSSLMLAGVSPACVEATVGAAAASAGLCLVTWLLACSLCGKRKPSAAGTSAPAGDQQEGDAEALKKEREKARNMERALQEAETKAQSTERDMKAAQRETEALKKTLEAMEAAGKSAGGGNGQAPAASTSDAGELQAKLAEVTGERDRYLQEWQTWYQSYMTMEQQHQTELAQRDEALAASKVTLEEAKQLSSAASDRSAAAAAAETAELGTLRATLQAREAELTDLRSRLGTLVPDAEERKEQLEQERARAHKLTSRCEQLVSQLEAAKTTTQAAELEADRLRAEVAGLKGVITAKEAQLASQRTGDASALSAAERTDLEQRLRLAEEQFRIVDKGHRDFLAYHNHQMAEKDRKLEISKELMDDRDQKREAQMQELRTR
jgi:hypothetical protein